MRHVHEIYAHIYQTNVRVHFFHCARSEFFRWFRFAPREYDRMDMIETRFKLKNLVI